MSARDIADGRPEVRRRTSLGRFGPSLYYIPGVLVTCPLTWLGGLLAVFRFSSNFRIWLWQVITFDSARAELIDFFKWSTRLPVQLHLILFGAAFLYALIRYFSSSFAMDAAGDLIINTGLLGWGTPRGPFVEFQLTIPAAVVGEVDISRNPIQFIFRTGTVVVTYRELDVDHHGHKGSATLVLPFILHPEQVRDAIMAGSQVHQARFIV